jgi:predicted DNA-binding mobile mystery protein A
LWYYIQLLLKVGYPLKPHLRELRISQIDRAILPLAGISLARPQKGWVRAIREALGITASALAKRLDRYPSHIAHIEKAETDYRITLGNLREAAEALDCDFVYFLVPRAGSLRELAERKARAQASALVRSVEHSMALEDQAVGGVEKLIEEETKRILRRKAVR